MSKSIYHSKHHSEIASLKHSSHLLEWGMTFLMLGGGISHGNATAQPAVTGNIVSVKLSSSAPAVKGWSVQRDLLGRPLVGDHNNQIGTVIDLLVTTAAEPFVLLIGVGGNFEIGGHAVALPRDAVVERDGVLHLVWTS